jgi:multimeric flavodoxin WrbA
MAKRILVLVGSPRKGGNTELLADAFLEGARESGNAVTKYCLRGKTIMPCVDCQYCYTHSGCALMDGMDEVYKLLSETDLLVFASPVYFWGFPAQLKALIDRLHNPARSTYPIRATALLTVAEDDDEAIFDLIRKTHLSIADYLGWEDKGMVAVGGVKDRGDIAGNVGLEHARRLGKSIA